MYNDKISMKEAQRGADKVIRIGYCAAYNLLHHLTRYGYNCGVYGWNCDIYRVYTTSGKLVAITTGYRNMRGESVNYDTLEKYEELAKAVSEYSSPAYIKDYDERINAINTILDGFLREICGDTMVDDSDIINTVRAEIA